MFDNRKQAVSIRMGTADVRKVKKLASRLGVRESDVIRFAIKSTLARLGPLHDAEVRGRNLVPVFVEFGSELLRYFELDAARLDSIINDGAGKERQVTNDDIALIAMSGVQENYAMLKLSSLGSTQTEEQGLSQSLRSYLYDKYVYRHRGDEQQRAAGRNGSEPVEPVATQVGTETPIELLTAIDH
jgi:hypothetical protein